MSATEFRIRPTSGVVVALSAEDDRDIGNRYSTNYKLSLAAILILGCNITMVR